METNFTPDDGKAKSKKGAVPASDVDFGTVATNVAAKWNTTPTISLSWTTAAEFTTQAAAYNTQLSQRLLVGGGRPQIKQALTVIEGSMDNALLYVKGYIIDKYKKDSATSYYPAFGIDHKGGRYAFPTDRNKRIASLDLMLSAIADNDFGDKEFGTSFWTDIQHEYQLLVNQIATTDGTISSKVSAKNTLKDSVKKTLNSLIAVIKGNYPDTYKAELRIWGFQKEKY